MQKNFFSNTYKRKKTSPKKQILEYKCKCCGSNFHTQGRYLKLGQEYTDYCSNCRKICYMCCYRHGGKGNTCSSYCANRYKKLRWAWKLRSNKALITLDRHLRDFKLDAIDTGILKTVYGKEAIYIQERSNEIRKAMLRMQNRSMMNNIEDKLIFKDGSWIHKKTFYIFKDQFYFWPVEKI